MNYTDFLKTKITVAPSTGIDVTVPHLNFADGTKLKPHQCDAINWAIRGGSRALFESFGLGKTIQQIIILDTLIDSEGGKALIVAPLGVRQEFKRDAWNKMALKIKYIRRMDEIEGDGIYITNYERVRDGDINPEAFTATSLDEASVLRSYGSKTYQSFLDKFQNVRFKFVATATPSPNKYKELIHYAGYLGVMDTGQALTRWFKRDSSKANNLTLHPHKEKEFWLWVSTWALYLTKPSDLGYSDEGYELPPMKVHYHEVKVDHSTAGTTDDGQGKLYRDAALGLRDAAREKRDSLPQRIEKMEEIISASPDDHHLIWHDLEVERHAVMKQMKGHDIADAYGSQDIDKREETIINFSEGKIKHLATKPSISGQGCNFQYHCHKAVFLGVGYKFNDFIQAIHRVYRFQQEKQVEIHIIYAESEAEILQTLIKKWKQHEYMVKQMISIMKENGLNSTSVEKKLQRAIGIEPRYESSELWTAVNNDTVLETSKMETESVDLIHTSIPFSNHYEYTPSYNDFGHNKDNDEFFKQMDFLTPELLRVLKPGRVAAIHVKDRILFGNATGKGMPTVDPFHADCIYHYQKHGFAYFGMITIVTDVVRENNQTYRLGWTENSKDSTKMGVGSPEYILLFRKLPTDRSKAYADEPVKKNKEIYTRGRWQIDAHAFWRSSGNRFLTPEEAKNIEVSKLQRYYREYSRSNIYDYHRHVATAEMLEKVKKLPSTFMVVAPGSHHPNVWDDVNRMYTLNSNQTKSKQENHICPLQFDIVERIIERYSAPGELVFDPFAGLMTVPYTAIKLGRKGRGHELNTEYFRDGVRYLKEIEVKVASPTLFQLEQITA